MKFLLREHSLRPGIEVIEVWHEDQFLATIAAHDTAPSLCFITKHPTVVRRSDEDRVTGVYGIDIDIMPPP